MTHNPLVAIIVISDRASRGEYEDVSGSCIEESLRTFLKSPFKAEKRIIPDNQEAIEKALLSFSQQPECFLILTTGGTGIARRDVTPEAMQNVCEKILPGFGERMRFVSIQTVPTAICSRQLAGVKEKTLIINLPGNPKAIKECLNAVFPAVPDCLDQLGKIDIAINSDLYGNYRPHHHANEETP